MRTRITLAAAALLVGACLFALARAEAAFGPVGEDQRISFTGTDGDPTFYAYDLNVAYNPAADEYLVVWIVEEDKSPSPAEREIWARRLSGAGAPLGDSVRVSPADGDASRPSAAYNPARNEYLVAWSGEIGTSDDYEIFARRLSAAGERLGADAVQVSQMGPGGGSNYSAFAPSVAVNPSTGAYLVVWQGDTNTMPLVDGEFEIFGQWLSAEGEEVPPNDFRISQQGADSNPNSDAFRPSVAYNPARNEYLVAWEGEIGTSDEFEIWAQLFSAGGAVVKDDFQLSEMTFGASSPNVAADPATGAYLVVWFGNDDPGGAAGGPEIFGQRLTAAGAPTGEDDFQISHLGPGHSDFSPSVAYDPSAGEYVVAWEDLSDGYAVFAQRLSAGGAEVGADFRSSPMGVNAHEPSVAANPAAGEYLVVWAGSTPPLHPDETEIFGRRLGVAPPTLVATDPAGPANDNNPRVKGSVAADSTVDLFTNGSCAGAPAVNDAPAAALSGAGIAVPVADNTTTQISATASSDGRTSRCSNSISYTELTPAPPPLLRDTVAPVVSGFAVVPGRFRVAGAAVPRGSRFRFRLSERASARIVLERALPGRRVGRRCLKPTRKLRVRARCTRFQRAGTLVLRDRSAGQNSVPFRGRIGRRALATGSYRATITATDPAGNRSRPRSASFRIVRR